MSGLGRSPTALLGAVRARVEAGEGLVPALRAESAGCDATASFFGYVLAEASDLGERLIDLACWESDGRTQAERLAVIDRALDIARQAEAAA